MYACILGKTQWGFRRQARIIRLCEPPKTEGFSFFSLIIKLTIPLPFHFSSPCILLPLHTKSLVLKDPDMEKKIDAAYT